MIVLIHVALMLAMVAATWIAGWWGIVLVAIAGGYALKRQQAGARRVAVAAAEGWLALLAIDALNPAFFRLTAAVGGSMRIPAAALLVTTLLFAALLAWSAAVVASEFFLRVMPRR